MSISPKSSPSKGSVHPVAMMISPASVMGGTTMGGAVDVAMGGATMGGAMDVAIGGATMVGSLAVTTRVDRHLQKLGKKWKM